MEILKDNVNSVTVARCRGRMDGASTEKVHEDIVPILLDRRPVLLDFTGVSHISEAGLRTLLAVYRQAQAVDGKVALVGLSTELHEVLSATGFLRFFVIAQDVEAGVAALAENPGVDQEVVA